MLYMVTERYSRFRWDFPVPGIPELIEKSARIAAREASADGLAWAFSPMVDIARDPRWGRVSEGSGEDPYLGSEIAAAVVRGYQGKDLQQYGNRYGLCKTFCIVWSRRSGT